MKFKISSKNGSVFINEHFHLTHNQSHSEMVNSVFYQFQDLHICTLLNCRYLQKNWKVSLYNFTVKIICSNQNNLKKISISGGRGGECHFSPNFKKFQMKYDFMMKAVLAKKFHFTPNFMKFKLKMFRAIYLSFIFS